jgi:outer membrane lipoprotein-sorting protein
MKHIWLIYIMLFSFHLNAGDNADPHSISQILDELYRSKSSHGVMSMQVINPRYTRTLKMEVWTLGKDHTLVRILAPKKEKGISTLKKKSEMWNYLPKIRKLIRIPPSMMMSSWMGSDFTNDDLVKESSWEDDYEVSSGPMEGRLQTLIFIPKPNAAVTWGKVVLVWDPEKSLPVRQDFYDEKKQKVREMVFSDIKNLGGRKIPSVLTLTPLTKKDRHTIITYQKMDFNVPLEPSFFTKSQIRQ